MMFDAQPTNAVFWLLLLQAVLCFIAYWLVWSWRDGVSLTGAWVKSGATGLLAAAMLFQAWGAAAQDLVQIMAVGLLFGAIGDFALARRNDRAFLLGMAAFAIGHLIYAIALWASTQNLLAMGLAYDAGQALRSGALSPFQIIGLMGLLCLLLSTELWLAPKTAALRWPVRGYVLVIGAMAAVTITLVDKAGAGLLRWGAALFVLSDLLLALQLFILSAPRWKQVFSLLLWPSYWLGQVLLMLGAGIYAGFPKG